MYIYLYAIYLCIYVEKLKNKVMQSEEFNVKESRHYNVLVFRMMISSVIRSPMDV